MMMQGEFDLNPVQIYTDSLKEVLKQTMINQDVVFRNQVHELHRIYRVQESIMQDFGLKECNGYSSWDPKAQSSVLAPKNHTRDEPLAKQTRSLTTEVGLIPFLSQEAFKDCKNYKLQPRPVDLHLSADEFIVEMVMPMKGNSENSLGGPVEFKFPISCGNSPNAEELKLSLCIGEDNRKVGRTMRTRFTKKSFSFSGNVIDLEESEERMLDECAKWPASPDPACLEVNSKGKHESQNSDFPGPVISINLKKELSHEIAESSSLHEYSECFHEQTFSNEGIKECHVDAPSDDHFAKTQQFASHQGGQFDLNKVLPDDNSCCSDDLMLVCPSTASSKSSSNGLINSMQVGACPTTFGGRNANECSNESEMLKQDKIINLALAGSNQKNKITDMSTKITGVDISEDIGCLKTNNVELESKLVREVSCEKSEVENAPFSSTEQSQNTFQDGHGSKSPASCKSYCISDNDSSSVKIKCSGITSGVSKTHLGSQVGRLITAEHDQKTSDSNDIESSGCFIKEESAKEDVLIQEAAELLLQISVEHSSCDQESCAKVECKETKSKKRERPQCSCDSFELMALNLTESSMDDNSVSSKPFEVSEAEMKDFGGKFRRGRRMKDFQKEILPNLASLSRHEILEDINIMEGVLRSREYRKMRAKMAAHDENWAAPVRSRRSRHSYAGRRNL